jgi:phenylacetate-CoA ligase
MFNWRKPIIYTLLYLSGSKIPSNLREIKRVDKLSLKEKKEYQEKKLKDFLLHAYNNVPYYKKTLSKANVVKKDKVYLKNFHKIPFLTKEIIRKEGKNLFSKEKRKGVYENTSGGSIGEPVRFLQDKYYDDWNNATKIIYKLYGKQNIGDKELRLWGSERDILEGKENLSIRIRNWLYNRKELNAFKMSEKEMIKFIEIWNQFKPQWIEAYAQPIYEFAKFIKEKGLKIYSPKRVLTSAGTLYPQMKKIIQEVFDCPILNRYGSREVGAISCSNRKSVNLKISFWHNYIEVLNNSKNQSGQIIITSLNNYSMPFIRYNIGDIGVKGSDWDYLEKIEGREMSVFKTKKGKLIPGEFFIHFIGVVFNKNFISKFQVIQKDYNLIVIKVIIKNKNGFYSKKNNIENSIKKVMGKNCKIKWEFVNEIKTTKSGKYLYTISELK